MTSSAGAESIPGVVAGGNGSGPAANQLASPAGIAVDGAGNLYIADNINNRVQRWAPGASSGTTVAGGYGSGPNANQFSTPAGVAVDGAGNVFVADLNNRRVQRWAPGATTGVTVAGGNGSGSGANQFASPTGVAVDGAGNVFVVDNGNHRVQRWAPGASSGVTVAGGNGSGPAADQLASPFGVAIDDAGNLYIADNGNHRVQRWAPGASVGVTVAGDNGSGSGADQLASPTGVAVDGTGRLYVADQGNHRVQRWAPGASSGVTIAGGNGFGSSPDQMGFPIGLAIDGSGALHVTDAFNSRVVRLSGAQVAGVPATPASLGSIPDGTSVPLDVAFPVSGQSGPVTDVAVTVEMNHTWVGDLQLQLIAPNGTTRSLLVRPGHPATGFGDSSNLDGTYRFTDQTAGDLWAAALAAGNDDVVSTGNYRSSSSGSGAPTGLTSGFTGVANRNGTWRLRVTDLSSGDTGSVTGAWLELSQSAIMPVAPQRLLDTRAGKAPDPPGEHKPGANEVIAVDVTGIGAADVPDTARAVVINVTATEPAGAGHVTVYPCGQATPLASNLNFAAGQTFPNLVTVGVGANGAICLASNVSSHLIVDLAAWHPEVTDIAPVAPQRLLDTRAGKAPDPPGEHKPAGNEEIPVQVTGVGAANVPFMAGTAVLNVTATQPSGAGHVTAYPCGESTPLASNLNFGSGDTVPNLVTVPIGADGRVCLRSNVSSHLIVDLAAWHPADSSVTSVTPQRLMDTRAGKAPDPPGEHKPAGNEEIVLKVTQTGAANVPANARAVVVNITATQPVGSGHVTVYPCGQPLPLASNLNFATGQTIANLVTVGVGTNGSICLRANVGTHLIADLAAWHA